MRAKAYLQMVVVWALSSCSTQSPCEAMGGRCTRPDVDCGPAAVFTGFDAQCEPDSKCCVPTGQQPQPVDAGDACSAVGGTCQAKCADGTVVSAAFGCSGMCCVPKSSNCKPKGRCATSCTTNEAIGFNAPDCPGMACCTPK